MAEVCNAEYCSTPTIMTWFCYPNSRQWRWCIYGMTNSSSNIYCRRRTASSSVYIHWCFVAYHIKVTWHFVSGQELHFEHSICVHWLQNVGLLLTKRKYASSETLTIPSDIVAYSVVQLSKCYLGKENV